MPGEKKVVRDQYYMLRVLSDKKTSPNLYKAIIKQSNKQLINALTQCSKNLLHNNKLILDQKVRQQFENNRDFFIGLAARKPSIEVKRRRLLTNQKLITLILPSILIYFLSTQQNGSTDITQAG